MFKRYTLVVLFVAGFMQAGVIDQMPQNGVLQDFVAYLVEHRDAVAQESNYVNISLTFVKDDTTSDVAWIGLLQHLIETMSVENVVRFVGKINEVMYDSEIANLHGGFHVSICSHHHGPQAQAQCVEESIAQNEYVDNVDEVLEVVVKE